MFRHMRGHSFEIDSKYDVQEMVSTHLSTDVLNARGVSVACFTNMFQETAESQMNMDASERPRLLGLSDGMYWWVHHRAEYSQPTGRGNFDRVDEHRDVYTTDRRLSDDDAAALVAVRLRKDDQELQRARTLVALPASAEATGTARARISDQAKIFVWQRDRGQCVNCQTNQDLEFDHVIPLAMGGSNTERNLQLLCGACNRDKGGNLV